MNKTVLQGLLALALAATLAGSAMAEGEDPHKSTNNAALAILNGGSGAAPSKGEGAVMVGGQAYLPSSAQTEKSIGSALDKMLQAHSQTAGNTTVSVPTQSDKLNFEIHFKKNSADLSEESIAGLDRLGEVLSTKHLDQKFILGGHTDMDGDPEVNQPLSQARADSARAYLVERFEIAPERLVSKGYGTSEPLLPEEKTRQDKQYNRRVDLRPQP